ncbi:MAG: 30S ribosomal protein S2 [Candidatus Harrisonbacteria bacterium]|nr:30S ribosomal protein S2 [Candidatus Harrisonbacteria bacterium]
MDVLVSQEEQLNKEAAAAPKDPAQLAMVEEMMKAGLFIGMKSSKTHPKMRPFIFGVRNRSSVINLEETLNLLEKAMEFIKKKFSEKGTMLLVGTTPAARNSVEAAAKNLKLPFVVERWLGGTLTNFKTLSKRIAYFKKLKSDKETGRLDKYTKKERLDFDRQIQKMTVMFGGVEEMDAPPDVVFVVDVNSNMTAVREANRLKIPVVGVMNTDTDPGLIKYPLPANDRSKASIEWILGRLEKAVQEGREQAKAVVPQVEVKA